MKEIFLFVKRFFSNTSSVGAILPSSKMLAHRMTRMSSIENGDKTRYLEVGAGSGAVTHHLLKKMKAGDTVDIVENDPKFCVFLRKKFDHLPHVSVHEVSILDFTGDEYDVIISSLPLNSFNATFVKQILLKFEDLIKEGGYLSYFEYMGLAKIKEFYLSGDSLVDFRTILQHKQRFKHKFCQEIDKIWWNFPPARVLHCKM